MSFTLADLVTKCEQCGGTGKIDRPRKLHEISPTERPCAVCDETGYEKLAEQGSIILDFIKIAKARNWTR